MLDALTGDPKLHYDSYGGGPELLTASFDYGDEDGEGDGVGDGNLTGRGRKKRKNRRTLSNRNMTHDGLETGFSRL